eukprot:COSAG01_NODE_3068_length_6640_cov_15.505580_1_plen_74_part_00
MRNILRWYYVDRVGVEPSSASAPVVAPQCSFRCLAGGRRQRPARMPELDRGMIDPHIGYVAAGAALRSQWTPS